VILVNPPHSFIETHRGREKQGKTKEILSYPPLGVLYLASALETDGIKVKVIDAPAHGFRLQETVHEIEKGKPVFVGISATTPQTYAAVQLAKTLRERYRDDLVIGLGGAHVSADPDFINRFPYFDFAIKGEGEITLAKIVRMILNGERLRGVYHGQAPSNLDEVPPPARHLVNNNLYFIPIHEKRFTSIIASRGCPYDCLYCSRPVIGRNVRFRSPRNVVAEMIECIDKFRIQWFQFVDDTMTLNRSHIIRLCDEILNRKLDIEWGCQTRVDLVDAQILSAMRKAGCREISFGIESGSERVRRVLRKNFKDESVFKAFKFCRKIGIETTAFFMLGLPTETRDDLYRTIEFTRMIQADYIEVHITTPFPGSDLFTNAIKEGRVPINVWDKYAEGKTENLPLYVPPTLIGEDLSKEQKRVYRMFYFRPHYILRRFFLDMSSVKKLKQDVKTAIVLMRW